MHNENEETLPEAVQQPVTEAVTSVSTEVDSQQETIELESAVEADPEGDLPSEVDEEATAAYVGSPLEDSGIDDNPEDIIEPDPPLPDYEFSDIELYSEPPPSWQEQESRDVGVPMRGPL